MDVVALNMPWKVLEEMKNVASVKTVQKHGKGSVTTLSMTSPDVPGGVVYHTSKEINAAGRLTRRSVLELKSFGLQAEEDRGVFGRKSALAAASRRRGKPHAGGIEFPLPYSPIPADFSSISRRNTMCRFQCSSSARGKSSRTWAPRLSRRSIAARIINVAAQSMFCSSQPPGSENCREST